MKNFNGLTPAESERLAILSEECAEVIQAVCKTLRHGYESTNPKTGSPETNRQMLEREIGDLLHALDRCVTTNDLDRTAIAERAASKPKRILPYLHHQAEPPAQEKCPKCGGTGANFIRMENCPACKGAGKVSQ